jgi:hypothetical protein
MIRRRLRLTFSLISLVVVYIVVSNVVQRSNGQLQLVQDDFPPTPKQLSVKIEMILPEEKLVEEFMMSWDEELNLARFDYALGRIMASHNTSRPTKTI